MEKQTRVSFKSKKEASTSRSLELLHLDLIGLITPTSLGRKSYTFVSVDHYSIFSWVFFFLAYKDKTFNVFEIFCKFVQNEKFIALHL